MMEAIFGSSSNVKETPSEEFKEAIEEDVNTDVTFDVTQEEVSVIRAELACEFPDDYKFLSDDYITSVASKPYSKDTSVRRPIEYTMKKLKDVMEWREGNAVGLNDMLDLAIGGDNTTEAVENPEKYTKAKAFATSLNYGSMYWHGLDIEGRPVLWIRTDRMPWYPDVEAQVNALILLADAGIQLMPKGVTDFVVLSDSNSPPPPNPQFMINLLSALVKGFPDRLHELVSCPVGSIIQFVMKLLLPLMPSRLASKIILIGQEDSKEKLGKMLMNGEDDIPTFLGGTADHDMFYPKEGMFPDKPLTFDYTGMKRRLESAVKAYQEAK